MQKGENEALASQEDSTTPIVPDNESLIAYFSMEIGLLDELPTYSGGLGVLAGDALKSFADLAIDVVGITLLSKKGYFYQKFDEHNWQQEEDYSWNPSDLLEKTDISFTVSIANRDVKVVVWKYILTGDGGHKLAIYFLDTDVEENDDDAKSYTQHLYGGDMRYRLAQELILGLAGIRLLRKLNLFPKKYHMNEGHAAFIVCELDKELGHIEESKRDQLIRQLCSFTTHTPVPSGHDMFSQSLISELFPQCQERLRNKAKTQHNNQDVFSMTKLALDHSAYCNAVSHQHQLVSQELFPHHTIDFITNGVHSQTWTNKHIAHIFDTYIPEWRRNPLELRKALTIPEDELLIAHQKAKQELIDYINSRYNAGFDAQLFTLGFARRATGYKRALLLLSNLQRLREISQNVGKIQLVFAGKAHPHDDEGKKIIQHIKEAAHLLAPQVRLVFIDNYTIFTGQLLTAGVDVWLNTPMRGLEASGTSGMKAAHNGVPSLSILDGWWVEGYVFEKTGWSIGKQTVISKNQDEINAQDFEHICQTLEKKILPLFYTNPQAYAQLMRSTIAINASYFNTHRMVKQYLVRAYTRNIRE
ncbi:MAG: alpha-glucan family phosphorylase [Candidatus Nanoarchaeia archaeon]